MEKGWALAMRTDEGEVERTELTVKRARSYVPWSSAWERGGAAGEESHDEGEGVMGKGRGRGKGPTPAASSGGAGSGRGMSASRIL